MPRPLLAALLALAALPASAVPPPVREPELAVPSRPSELSGFGGAGPYRLYDDWLVVCDNVASCTAVSVLPDAAATLQITRSGGWDDLPVPVLDLSRAGYDGPTVSLVLQPGDRHAHRTPGRRARTRFLLHRLQAGRFGLAPGEREALLAAAHDARSAQFAGPDGRVLAEVSLRGLVPALNRFDHVQGRTGTVTGIYTHGEILVPLAAIMPPDAPSLPAQYGVEEPDNARLGTRGFLLVCGTGVARRAGDAAVWRMASGHRLVAVDCGVDGLNGGRIWLVTDTAGQIDLASFPTPDLPANQPLTGFLPNGWFDHATGQLHALELGREAGDCGSSLTWQWTGTEFRLAEALRMPLCTGLARDLWPRTWTSRLVP